MAGRGGRVLGGTRTEPSPPGLNLVTVEFPATAGPPSSPAYTEEYSVQDATFTTLLALQKGDLVDTTGTQPAIGSVTIHKAK